MRAVLKAVRRTLFICLLFASAGSLYAAPSDSPVYVSNTGKKYHRIDCRLLRNSKHEIRFDDAVNTGYAPCAVCKPAGGNDAFKTDAVAAYRVNIAGLASYRQADIKKMLSAKVTRHVDGDTVHITIENPPAGLNRIEKIRMIGVDTPETRHPNRALEYFGVESSGFTKDALLNKDVLIALDWDTRDKYGRLLAYIYTADGKCHNAELIKQGFAHAYTRFPFQFLEEFLRLEQEARAGNKGLWAGEKS
ncbi:MAG: thermonuclease family protein [Spirochaetaceae bacterium]|jgi:micrococcal nuclease|nr:thermonuclease family protein [Spirochaetaceae bacterium]